jgi:hypothetical protein
MASRHFVRISLSSSKPGAFLGLGKSIAAQALASSQLFSRAFIKQQRLSTVAAMLLA